jgi:hypothetical protein
MLVATTGSFGMNCIKGCIKSNREAATRARQLLTQMSLREERERLLAFAEALDVKTDALERELAGASRSGPV